MDFHDFPKIVGNLGVETDHPPKMCAGLCRTTATELLLVTCAEPLRVGGSRNELGVLRRDVLVRAAACAAGGHAHRQNKKHAAYLATDPRIRVPVPEASDRIVIFNEVLGW